MRYEGDSAIGGLGCLPLREEARGVLACSGM